MTLTTDYSRLHRAMMDVAGERGLGTMDIRILLAIAERGGTARRFELEADLNQPTITAAIRRSLRALRPHLVTTENPLGPYTPIRLTAEGRRVVDRLQVLMAVA